MNEVICDTDIP